MYSSEFRTAVTTLAKQAGVYESNLTIDDLYMKLTAYDPQITHTRIRIIRYDADGGDIDDASSFSVELGALRYLPADIHTKARAEQLEIYDNLCCKGASRGKPRALCISTSKIGSVITQTRDNDCIKFSNTSARLCLTQGGCTVALSEYDFAVYHVIASYYKQGTVCISFDALASSFRKTPRPVDFVDLLDSLEYMQEVIMLLDDSAEAARFGYPTTFTYSDRRYFLPIRIHVLRAADAISGRSWIELIDAPPLLQYDMKYNQTYDLPTDVLQVHQHREKHKLYVALANYVARRVATILQRASVARKYRTISVDAAAAALGSDDATPVAYSPTHRDRFAKEINTMLEAYEAMGLFKKHDTMQDEHKKITGFVIYKNR